MPRLAALPMYGLPEVRGDLDVAWTAIRAALAERSVDAPTALSWPDDLHRSWERPDLLLSQTCGYPLVGALHDRVRVLGTFASDIVSPGGHYRSVLICRPATRTRIDQRAWPELVAAVNGRWSLSGWISLLAATTNGGTWPGSTTETGGHVASVELVRQGIADIASIDAITFALLARHRPAALEGVVVWSQGPRVPALPLVTAAATDDATFGRLREALVSVNRSTNPAVRAAFDRLLVDRFVPLDAADYRSVADLVTGLGVVAPPWP